jgi:hypothetical protein
LKGANPSNVVATVWDGVQVSNRTTEGAHQIHQGCQRALTLTRVRSDDGLVSEISKQRWGIEPSRGAVRSREVGEHLAALSGDPNTEAVRAEAHDGIVERRRRFDLKELVPRLVHEKLKGTLDLALKGVCHRCSSHQAKGRTAG